MSIVNIVLVELKILVNDDIRAFESFQKRKKLIIKKICV